MVFPGDQEADILMRTSFGGDIKADENSTQFRIIPGHILDGDLIRRIRDFIQEIS